MVNITEVQASNARATERNVPKTAVFVGGTAGIGRAALTELVSNGFPIKVYLVGRNQSKHQSFVEELRASNKSAEVIFLEGEISLMAESARLCGEIAEREQSLDLAFLSSGFLPFLGRKETSEGVELSTAVAYYSRMIFIRRLIPLLKASAASGVGYTPRVVNILGSGVETEELFLQDLTMKQPGHFNIPNYASHAATMTTVEMGRLAERAENQGIVFIHNHPGLVSTDIFKKSWGDDWNDENPPRMPAGGPSFTRSTVLEAGQRSLYLITSAKYGGTGISNGEGQPEGFTLDGLSRGALFCVSDTLETLRRDQILAKLRQNGGIEAIWNQTQEVISPYT